jgi:cinnamoyl-CoA:phenyllactate CoA-transferase
MIPFGAPYLCADKRWFMPQVVDFYRDSPRFYKVIGAEDMMENPLYKDRNDFNKVEICGPVVARFEKIFATKTAKEWEALFIANDLSCEILATYEDTLVDEQAIVNNYVYNMKYKNGREIKLIRPPLYSDNLGLPEYNPAPMLGENTVEILKGLGYSDEEIKKLLEAKVVKQHD